MRNSELATTQTNCWADFTVWFVSRSAYTSRMLYSNRRASFRELDILYFRASFGYHPAVPWRGDCTNVYDVEPF